MNGGASQIDTFDMKPGRPTGGPFRPIASNVTGLQVCEYLPRMAKMADRLAVVRSMRTSEPDHPNGIYSMHTGQRPIVNVSHPELGATGVDEPERGLGLVRAGRLNGPLDRSRELDA